jgi:hypothetical protein
MTAKQGEFYFYMSQTQMQTRFKLEIMHEVRTKTLVERK